MPSANFMNQKIDELLKIKRRALYDLEKSVESLYELGVTFVSPGEDGIPELSSAMKLTERYEKTLENWEWKVIYTDGSELDQYGEEDHSFRDIKLDKIEKVLLISNFEFDTTNVEKRAVITLNRDGTFDFLNCGPMELRGKLNKPVGEGWKLILFKRFRDTFTAKTGGGRVEPTGEKILYKRYFLGYEINGIKTIVCAYPNGEVRLE